MLEFKDTVGVIHVHAQLCTNLLPQTSLSSLTHTHLHAHTHNVVPQPQMLTLPLS